MNNPTRTAFFIDGFNVYHSIANNHLFHKYKWLNYRKLAECFTTKTETIQVIYYFTALAEWNRDKECRHKNFIRVLDDLGIKTVYGKYKLRDKFCKNCKTHYQTYEEKQTDVNIAIQLLKSATLNEFDKAFIVSGDSDLLAAIKTVKTLYPEKTISAIFPFGRKSDDIAGACDSFSKIKIKHLQNSRLDDPFVLTNSEIINCPREWK